MIGLDWVELPVKRPAYSAMIYRAIGFVPRGSVGARKAVAIGGTVLMFKRATSARTGSSKSPTGIMLQVPVDNVELKRQQLIDLGFHPGRPRRQPRGDRAFEWRDPDGHTIRFVGPARQPHEKTFND